MNAVSPSLLDRYFSSPARSHVRRLVARQVPGLGRTGYNKQQTLHYNTIINTLLSADKANDSFHPRDAMLARSLRQRRVCLSVRPSVTAGIVQKRCILDAKLL